MSKKYLELAPGARLREVDTPFLPEDQNLAPCSIPVRDIQKAGGVIECEWCKHTMPANTRVYKTLDELSQAVKERRKLHEEMDKKKREEEEEEDRGELAPVAASIV